MHCLFLKETMLAKPDYCIHSHVIPTILSCSVFLTRLLFLVFFRLMSKKQKEEEDSELFIDGVVEKDDQRSEVCVSCTV